MITSEGNFIIATPTKCATTTLEAVANRHQRESGADGDLFRIMDWDSPRRQHRMALPPAVDNTSDVEVEYEGEEYHQLQNHADNEWGDVDRWLLVRNPYTRYMSMYTYLSAPANYSQWGAREIQRGDWGGHDPSKVVEADRPRMEFEEFLFWIAEKREEFYSAYEQGRRGALWDGFAYRSPWVWLDSLSFSLAALQDQPGKRAGDVEGLLRMEELFDVKGGLTEMLRAYGLAGEVNLRPLHSNRSTGWGDKGAHPGHETFWGGIKCSRMVFDNRRQFRPDRVAAPYGCPCAACAVGVAGEAESVGYLL